MRGIGAAGLGGGAPITITTTRTGRLAPAVVLHHHPNAWSLLTMTVLHKVLGLGLRLARQVGVFAAAEGALYRRIEARLAGPAPLPVGDWWQHRLPLPPVPVVRQALAAGPAAPGRLIDPAALGAEDLAALRAAGLDLAALLANRAADPAAALPALTGVRPDTVPPVLTGPAAVAFQEQALARGALTAVCPWRGRPLVSTCSFLAEPNGALFYRFEGAEVFYLAVGREGRGWVKLYLWLPARALALLLTEPYRWHGWDEIELLRAHLIARHRAVRALLADPAPAPLVGLVDQGHFAHHLWNALTGLERLVEAGLIARLDRLLVGAEPWGPLAEIFPELAAVRLQACALPALPDAALARRWCLLRPGGNRISEGLLRRLRRVAARRATPGTAAAVARLRAEHWPVLWVTLRTADRTWVRQRDGLIQIARWLRDAYPRAALILDGFSVPFGPPHLPASVQSALIGWEQAEAAAIRSGLGAGPGTGLGGRLPVLTLSGASLFDVTLYAGAADLYLAHHGSLQHKIGWLGDCPGLVHGNRLALTDPRLQDAAFAARPGGIPPVYLDAALVTDARAPVQGPRGRMRWPDDLANYDCDPAALWAALAPLIRPRPAR